MTEHLGVPAASATASGRPAWRRLRVGVDIGGSKVAVLVVDEVGSVRARHLVPAASSDPAVAIDQIATTIRETLARAGASLDDVDTIGVGVPGRVDAEAGTVTFAVNLGWHDFPLRDGLEAVLGVPCVVENDVRAAATGLWHRATFGPVEDLVYLSIGTGISAGVVLGGRLHRGGRGIAGEIGHVVLDPDGPLCACGLRGCFEALAAGPAIARSARDAVAAGRPSTLADIADPTAVDVFAAAREGDAVGLEIVERTGVWVARAVHELVLAYDVALVVIGGGVARAGDGFLRPIQDALERACAASPFAAEVLGGTVIRLLPRDLDAGAWGAVVLVDGSAESPADRPNPATGRRMEVGHG